MGLSIYVHSMTIYITAQAGDMCCQHMGKGPLPRDLSPYESLHSPQCKLQLISSLEVILRYGFSKSQGCPAIIVFIGLQRRSAIDIRGLMFDRFFEVRTQGPQRCQERV